MEAGSTKKKIIELRKQGKSYNEIKKKLNCSKATISYHCKREALNDIGLNTTKKLNEKEVEELKEFYKNHTAEETSIMFNVSVTTVKKYSDRKNFTYETDDDRRKSNYLHVKDFRSRMKIKAVEYKGGKCVVCGYDRCVKGLEFHHTNPEEKDFTLGSNTNRAWEKVKVEIDKCVLLCANCHREIHDGLIKLDCSLIGKASR